MVLAGMLAALLASAPPPSGAPPRGVASSRRAPPTELDAKLRESGVRVRRLDDGTVTARIEPTASAIPMALLEQIGEIHSVSISHRSSTRVDLSGLERLSGVRTVWIRGPIASLEPVCALPDLEVLAVQGSEKLDLSCLRRAHQLTSLRVREGSYRGWKGLAGAVELRHLNVANPIPLEVLAPLGRLETLNIQGELTDSLDPLAGLSSLRELSIRVPTGTDLEPLGALPQLETLRIKGPELDVSSLANAASLRSVVVSGKGARGWSRLDQVESVLTRGAQMLRRDDGSLEVRFKSIFPEHVAELQAGTTFERVVSPVLGEMPDLGDARITDLVVRHEHADLQRLAKVRGLRRLTIRGVQIRNISALSGVDGLESLDLSWTTGGDLAELAKLESLRRLVLHRVPVPDLKVLRSLRSLQFLDIRGTSVSDLAPLRELENLRHVDARGTPLYRVDALRLQKSIPRVEVLVSNETDWRTDL